jgi:hypothetical protein
MDVGARLLIGAALGAGGLYVASDPDSAADVFRDFLGTVQAGDALAEGVAAGTVGQLEGPWLVVGACLWALMIARPIVLRALDMAAEAQKHQHLLAERAFERGERHDT